MKISIGTSLALVVLVAAAVSGCPTHNKQVRTAEGRCALILSTEEYESGSLGGEASLKGIELGKAKISAEQADVFRVQLDDLQQDFNNMSHDMCLDWAHGALTNQQYMESKACLRSTTKKLRIMTLGLESGTVDAAGFQSQLVMLMGEVDKCEPLNLSGSSQVATASQPGGCASDAECKPPLYCILGGCRPIGQQGDQCGFDWDCASPMVCTAGACAQPAGTSNVVGSPCGGDPDCEPPLYCIMGGCRFLGNVGDGCQFGYDCVAPLECSSGRCAVAEGAGPTTLGTPCQGDEGCTPPLFCIQKTCRPLGNPGDKCGIDADCYSPYVCTSGVCAVKGGSGDLVDPFAPPPGGKPCSADPDCVKPEYCIVGKCRPLQPAGGVCAANQDCVAGHTCVAGTCQKSQAGTPCEADMDCTPPNYCIVGTCRPLSGKGGVCSIDADCMQGLKCSSGSCQ